MSNQQPYPYDGRDGRDGHQEPHPSAQEPYTQTWDGPTWDTQYQPVQQPYRPQEQSAAGTAYPAYPAHPSDLSDPSPRNGAYAPPPEAQGAYDPYPQAQGAYDPYPQDPAAHDPAAPASGAYGYPAAAAPGAYGYPAAAYDPAPAPAPAAAPAAASRSTDHTAYSAPTTLGNARPLASGSARTGEAPLTAAQRARAEGRSPIIAPGMQPAALTAGLSLLLAGTAAVGPYALLVPLVLLQAVTAAGWFRLNGMWPARQGIALAFLGGVTADIVLLAVGAEHAPAAIIGTLGVWVLLALVLQLRNRAPADERMYGLTATVTSAALAVLAAGHLTAAPEAVTVGGVAVAVAALARALPLSGVASVVVALLAATGAGVAVGGTADVGAGGALLGLAAGGCALIGLRVASYDYPSRFVHMTAGVALPLTAAAPAAYLIGRIIT
ncbi:hypothetical protein [Streptomyces sp. Wb2n-11]|uniref:hypothetical protein n=1 Tax=Streptomyces sp. Wb2n-11 TaxID=1030533 RepID=UPI000A3FF070|nr:hypothetical protein [Streptomyces sp. Wb2n-11]